jgi:hypothetical protein
MAGVFLKLQPNTRARTEDSPDDQKENFYDALDKAYMKCPRHDIKVIICDLSAKVGRGCAYEPNIGKEGLHEETNGNGQRLVDFAISRSMVIGGTHFPHKKIHTGTWKSPDSLTTNQIDHALVDARHRSSLIDVQVYRGADMDSDHYLLASRIY